VALDVAGTAVRLLTAIEDWYADPANAAAELPARRYVAAGEPRLVPWDDSAGQVTVTLSTMPLGPRPDLPGGVTQTPARNRPHLLIRTAVYELQIVRPAPIPGYGGEPPTRDVLNAAGLAGMHDIEQVMRCLNRAQTRGRIVGDAGAPDPSGPAPVQVPTIETVGPTGGLTGIAVQINVTTL
jgi:hypothetical protein